MISRSSLQSTFLFLVILSAILLLLIYHHRQAHWIHTLYFNTETQQFKSPKTNQIEYNFEKSVDKGIFGIETTETYDSLQDITEQEEDPRFDHSDSSTRAPFHVNERPWFMKDGTIRPRQAAINPISGRRIASLWPHEDFGNDRIVNQIMFVPPHYTWEQKLKKILFVPYLLQGSKLGRDSFLEAQCPVNTCNITTNNMDASTADAIFFYGGFVEFDHVRPHRQVWIRLILESPVHELVTPSSSINWTASYRSDSDIVTPYAKWIYYDERIKQNPFPEENFAAGKSKKVAWVVSNCLAKNNRMEYADELKKYIQVDVYGRCGTKKCPPGPRHKCLEMLQQEYKFYLAFENSNCREYITEKLYVNALGHKILPVVMGARPDDYARVAPEHSYIHVDDFSSPRELATYLHILDQNDDHYNSYFRWRGTGEFINVRLLCRLCALLHDEFPTKNYQNTWDWWNATGVCTKSWK